MKERISGRVPRFNIKENKLKFAAVAGIGLGSVVSGTAYAEGYDPIGFDNGSESGHTIMQQEEDKTIISGIAKDGKAESPPPTATPTPEPTPSQAQQPESEPLYVHPEPEAGPKPPGTRYLNPQNPLIYEKLAEKYFGDQAQNALKVMACESMADANATGLAGEYGLWQIHPVHDEKFYRLFGENTDKYDPEQNAAVALEIFSEQGWDPWTTESVLYNGGYCPNGMHVSELFAQPMPNE